MLVHRLTKFTLAAALGRQSRALSVLDRFTSSAQPETASDIWRSVGAVCFDVDSTVCEDEGIDVLAEHCGAGKAVQEWTTKAMNGNVKFEDALAARLDIIKPSSIKKLMATLQDKGIAVFLLSGYFAFFDVNGDYAGFDDAELTSRDGGKAQAIDVIKRIHGYEK
ncbi:Phosphoserine phosphatase SerB, variant, partial [Phytophthora palmivora]